MKTKTLFNNFIELSNDLRAAKFSGQEGNSTVWNKNDLVAALDLKGRFVIRYDMPVEYGTSDELICIRAKRKGEQAARCALRRYLYDVELEKAFAKARKSATRDNIDKLCGLLLKKPAM